MTTLPLLLLLGCTSDTGTLAPTPSATPTPSAAPTPPVVKDPGTPSVPDAAAALAVGTNRFGAAFWRAIEATPGDVVVSPASIAAALAMTASGARGETADELTRVLRSGGTGWGALIAGVEAPERGARIRVANRLFGEQTYSFSTPWLDATARDFGAPLQPLDFHGAAEPSRETINTWVAERTEGKITGLLPPRSVTSDTRLVLVNAVHLLAKWAEPFEPRLTGPAPFHAPSGTRDVPTMNLSTELRVGTADNATIVELPYERGDTTMLVVLPDAGATLQVAEDTFDRWYAALGGTERVALSLPRFEVKPAAPLALRSVLEGMGVRLAFDAARADFSGMAAPADPADRIAVSEVFHKAYARVDEAGTEAAAATAVAMPRGGMRPPPAREVRVDRPFLFLIRDSATGLVLFVGRVSEPSGG